MARELWLGDVCLFWSRPGPRLVDVFVRKRGRDHRIDLSDPNARLAWQAVLRAVLQAQDVLGGSPG